MRENIFTKAFYEKFVNIPAGAKASIAFVFCSILQQGIQFITVPVFTRILSTDQYGQCSLYQSWLTIFSVIITLNLSGGCFNNGMRKYPEDRGGFISSLQGLCTVLGLVWFGFFLLTPGKWSELLSLPEIVLAFMLIETLLTPSLNFWMMRERYEFRYKLLVTITLIKSAVYPVIGIIAVFMTKEKGVSRCFAASLVNIAFALIFYVYNARNGKHFFVKKYWKFALKFNIPLVPHYLSQITLGQSDRIMIGNYFGESYVAIYSVAYNVGMVMTIIINSVNASFVPWTYEKVKAKEYKDIEKMSNKLALLIAFITLVPVALGPEAVLILGGHEYKQAIWVIPPVAVSFFLTFLYTLFANIEFYYEKSVLIMIASIVAATLNIILNVVFMQIYGYIAAGYTTAASYLTVVIMHYLFMRHICRKKRINSSIYNLKQLAGISIVLIILVAVFMFTYNYWIVRYILVLSIMLQVFVKRKEIMNIIKLRKAEKQ